MNHERDDEYAARKIVERVLGIQLEHADVNGEVDYLSSDRSIALEVTRVTEKEKKDTRSTFEKSATDGSEARLQTCWTVTVSEVLRPARDIVQRVQPLVAELESVGLTSFDEQDARDHVDDNGEFSYIHRQLLNAGVAEALPLEERPDCPEHDHCVRISPWGGGPVGDSNSSLAKLIEELEKPKMRKKAEKLRRSGAKERHLFVWLDDDTEGSISRPLSHEPPTGAGEEWGKPTDRPTLDSAITHLWIVHERSGMGWRWDGGKWWALHEPQTVATLNAACDGT